MNCKAIITAAFIAALPVLPAQAQADSPAPAAEYGRDARIPFADTNGIRDFRADSDSALWIQDIRRNWYHAETLGPCIGLRFATSVGFVTPAGGTLDRFSQIRVEGRNCPLKSLVTSAEPPPKAKREDKAEN